MHPFLQEHDFTWLANHKSEIEFINQKSIRFYA
jgi:hypothetical protein